MYMFMYIARPIALRSSARCTWRIIMPAIRHHASSSSLQLYAVTAEAKKGAVNDYLATLLEVCVRNDDKYSHWPCWLFRGVAVKNCIQLMGFCAWCVSHCVATDVCCSITAHIRVLPIMPSPLPLGSTLTVRDIHTCIYRVVISGTFSQFSYFPVPVETSQASCKFLVFAHHSTLMNSIDDFLKASDFKFLAAYVRLEGLNCSCDFLCSSHHAWSIAPWMILSSVMRFIFIRGCPQRCALQREFPCFNCWLPSILLLSNACCCEVP